MALDQTTTFPDVPMTSDFKLSVAIAIAGGSGTGKTYSGLLAARGLANGGPIAVIDTENKRALHYRRDFPEMQHYNFGPEVDGQMVGFPPERWIALIDQIEKTGAKAMVIDSFSHAWEGIGGVLEMQARAVEHLSGGDAQKAARVGQLAWASVKPRYRRLVERIVQASTNVIICMRAKPVMQEGFGDKRRNARDTKLRRADLPWDIAADRDLIFEMSASMLMVPEHPGQPILLKCPDHFRGLFAGNKRVDAEMGERMRAWAEAGGADPEEKALLDGARTAARGGRDALQAFWAKLDQAQRAIVNTIMDELKCTATTALPTGDDNLFADEDAMPSDEEKARAMAEAEAAAKEQTP